jgi:bifunctional UDP-N-acetylglucosamine pyrophosphorylase/glucosamine-1-phosphate N-acetyltransferase
MQMQAVLFAAGRGTRMGELTAARPKPMLEVAGKPLLQHKIEALPEQIDEVIIVVGYCGHVVQEYFGGTFAGKRILYVEQENPTGGTAEALWKAKDVLHDSFIVMNGDNIYSREDMEALIETPDWAAVVQEMDPIGTARTVVENGLVTDIVENSGGQKGFANIGLYKLDMRIFNYTPVPKAPGSTELGLPQTMLTAKHDIAIHAVPSTFWFEIKSPESLQQAKAVMESR